LASANPFYKTSLWQPKDEMTIDEARVIDAKAFMLSVYSMGLLNKDMEQANIN